jgi:hypothetical protein
LATTSPPLTTVSLSSTPTRLSTNLLDRFVALLKAAHWAGRRTLYSRRTVAWSSPALPPRYTELVERPYQQVEMLAAVAQKATASS